MRRQYGFTLIELMIVVSVIAIIAILALPSFAESLRRGKRAEAMEAIGDVQLRQEAWRSNNTTYGNTTAATAVLGNLFGSVANVTAYNSGFKYYSIDVSGVSATGYTITATRKGSMANDPKCGEFTMVVAAGVNIRGVSSGDTDYCWRQ